MSEATDTTYVVKQMVAEEGGGNFSSSHHQELQTQSVFVTGFLKQSWFD